jgi:gluconokinase
VSPHTDILVVIVMGAAASGKTTVGRLLAASLGWRFVEGDALHSDANIAKMHRGEPLTDEDREPWLLRVKLVVDEAIGSREPCVVACSALKDSYRQLIRDHHPEARFVYLRASAELLRARLQTRTGHFAGVALLESQLHTLEEPSSNDAVVVDAALTPEQIVDVTLQTLGLRLNRES